MPDAVALFMLSLAVWRVAVFVTRESGPFSLARRMREGAGIVHDDEGVPVGFPEHTIAKAIECLWCSAFWLSWPVVVAWQAAPILIVVLAVAAAAVLIELAVGWLQQWR